MLTRSTKAKISDVRYALNLCNEREKAQLLKQSFVVGMQSTDSDLLVNLAELERIKNVGESSAKEIMFALYLLMVEEGYFEL